MSCQRAGIKGVTPHTLRHTAGTLMALAGVDLFLIAKVLGHSVQKTTELYAHFQPSYLRGAVDALAKAMPVASVTQKTDAAQTAATFH
jgi:integrase